MNSGVLVICGFGVVYGFMNWFGKASGAARFFGLLGCCRLREAWRLLSWVPISMGRRRPVSKAWSEDEWMVRCWRFSSLLRFLECSSTCGETDR